ncbi:MAG TPA: VTT domain-containing protein [Candidatus Kapabacteria bacterium]|nr:VTT domain-containing protein [Candidatus Kapabacteria bacterium]
MDLIHQLFSSDGLQHLVRSGGMTVLCAIIFAETGLLVGFFLPGDTLLLAAGLLWPSGVIPVSFIEMDLLLGVSAIAGNVLGYYIGRTAGKKLYERPNSKLFKREHLIRTHAFYEKHGGKTMVLARFIPIVRTFAPVVAGAAEMGYKRFMVFNIIGGFLWVFVVTSVGYSVVTLFPGLQQYVQKYLEFAILGVICLSLLLPVLHWLRDKTKTKPQAAAEK